MSEIQSVLFDINKYDTKKTRKWLKSAKLVPIKRVHKTDENLRYRIRDPSNYKRFRTKKVDEGVKFILGFKN